MGSHPHRNERQEAASMSQVMEPTPEVAAEQIVSFLSNAPTGMTPPELVERITEDTRFSAADVRDALWRLVAEGRLQLADNMKLVNRTSGFQAQK
jgi:hypothetical protein